MTRRAWTLAALLTALPSIASAQPPGASGALNDTQHTGMRLFAQSCSICHTRPQMTSGSFGPLLSRESLGGQDDVMREVISNGTPRMPGFKYHFEASQIDAIVAYIKTVPAPAGGTK
jgi:mono/diheme cytochrome c family protein